MGVESKPSEQLRPMTIKTSASTETATTVYIVLHDRHFVRHPGICNQICVKLLQLMCAVILHNSVKELSLYINKWLSNSKL